MKKLFSALLILPFMAGMAMADFTDSAAGGDFPDNDPTGLTSTIAGSGGGMVTDVMLTIEGLNHTWAGDLNISLEHDGTVVNLSNRPGVDPVAGGFGFNIDLAGDFVFADGNANFDASVEQQQANTEFGGDGFLTGDEGPFSGNDALAGFVGSNADGDWNLIITDNAGGDLGGYAQWTLTVSTGAAIPEPATFGVLIGMAGLGLVRRRR